MELKLNYEQTARLELIALHSGKSTAQTLIDAAQYLLDRDAADSPEPRLAETQKFLSEEELATRLSNLLPPDNQSQP